MTAHSDQPSAVSDGIFDDNLACLSPADLRRVRTWVEDRFVNAISPLGIRLQRESPVNMQCDATLQEAQRAVERVMTCVREIRRMDDAARGAGGGG